MLTSLSASSWLLGFAGFLLALGLDLRRRRVGSSDLLRLGILSFLDLLAPAATFGCALALCAQMWPAAMREGVLHVRTVAFPGALACLIAGPLLWTEGRKQMQFQRPTGLIFGEWLFFAGAVLTSITTALDFDRAARLWSLAPVVAGLALIAVIVPPFVKKFEGLTILEAIGEKEQFSQPEYTPPTQECPQPQLWKMLDAQSTEVEVLDFLKALVVAMKPRLIVETGTFLGHGTLKLAEGLRHNGFGRVITIELDPAIRARALERFKASGLSGWIESRLESSLDAKIDGTIDLLFSDSHLPNREAEVRRLLPHIDPRGLVLIHDASSHFHIVREAVLRLEAEGLISSVLMSTPRGLAIAQRREGRR